MNQHETDPIGYLMQRKFPSLLKGPRISNGVQFGTTPPEQMTPEATLYRSNLRTMPAAVLRQTAADEREREVADWVSRAAADDQTLFFSQPGAVADIDHWARMDFWSVEEGLALSFGKAPEVLTSKRVSVLGIYSPFATEYRRRAEVARRSLVAKHLYENNRPSVFLRWAQRKGMNPPGALVDAVEAAGGDLTDWRDLYDSMKEASERHTKAHEAIIAAKDGSIAALLRQIELLRAAIAAAEAKAAERPQREEPALKTRERDSLLKLVIGMAVGAYSYDPKAGRSPTVSEIVDDLERTGISMDADTVRKYLTEAKQHLPDQV